MTLEDLRVFVACCRTGNLSAVARELSCTQSAVSQHVRRLERELGVALLERRPRGVAPTEAGRVLLEAVEHGLGHLDQARRRLGELARGEAGTVRVVTGATTVRHFMAAGVQAFRAARPDVSLEFRTENSSRNCVRAVLAGEADLAWITIQGERGGVEQRPVARLPWRLAVARDHPLAGRAAIEPGDLAGLRLIRLPAQSTSGAVLEAWLAAAGVDAAGPASVADWDTAVLLAELGVGAAVVPATPGAYAAHASLRLIPIPALPRLTVGWAARRWSALSPLTREFADTIAAAP
ncbi:LysR family transcriptional regulator [Dactylosporangium sp. CA-139066]|uniref:LysR family transcriptional regulator n=1 Tax=Dactylosporangium sp. CA-139066 TaxID=3239930 RepID=UPI003D8C9672